VSKGTFCHCAQKEKAPGDRRWVITQYQCNHSAFSGYKKTHSAYSEILCLCCGARWRTKAEYVLYLDRATDEEKDCTGDGDERGRMEIDPPCEGGDNEDECCSLAQDCEMVEPEEEDDTKPQCFGRPGHSNMCDVCVWAAECGDKEDEDKTEIGSCSACNGTFTLRANGTIPSHGAYRKGQGCPGGGKKPSQGKGELPKVKRPYTCSQCEGSGKQAYTAYVFGNPVTRAKKCPTCKGTGEEMRI
jgi:hypothetical protein